MNLPTRQATAVSIWLHEHPKASTEARTAADAAAAECERLAGWQLTPEEKQAFDGGLMGESALYVLMRCSDLVLVDLFKHRTANGLLRQLQHRLTVASAAAGPICAREGDLCAREDGIVCAPEECDVESGVYPWPVDGRCSSCPRVKR